MYKVIIKENKTPLYVGVADVVVFSLFLIFCAFDTIPSGDIATFIICTFIFLIFIALGTLLILDYAFRCVVLSDEICYRQTIFHKRHIFQCLDIVKCCSIFYAGSLQFRLYDEHEHCLAKFESNMDGVEDALDFITKKSVLFEESGPKSKVLKILLPEEDNNARKSYPMETINKIRSLMKYMNYILLIGIVIVCVCFELRSILLYCACIPLLWYILYLVFYPIVVFDKSKGNKAKDASRLTFPILSTSIALLVLLSLTRISNMRSYSTLFTFIFVTAIVLFIPYLIICNRRESKTSKRKKLSVFFALLFYCFSSSYAWNWICRVKEATHETVVVQDMRISSGGKSGSSYYLKVMRFRGDIEEVEVSSSYYKRLERFDVVELCKRESIFQVEYWYVHD